jgi:hypothetical protein
MKAIGDSLITSDLYGGKWLLSFLGRSTLYSAISLIHDRSSVQVVTRLALVKRIKASIRGILQLAKMIRASPLSASRRILSVVSV